MSRIKCGGLKNDPIGTTPVIMPKNADASRLSVPNGGEQPLLHFVDAA